MKTFKYPGQELDVFALASNWKQYWGSRIFSHIKGHVLEVGAGIGNNTIHLQELSRNMYESWTCLEPDPAFVTQLKQKMAENDSESLTNIVKGTIETTTGKDAYDTILYIDVLEHIYDDASELEKASRILSFKGHLVVVAPALSFLYTDFDKSIGHYRRYTIPSLKRLTPKGCQVVMAAYLDSMGVLASLANRLLLRQNLPTSDQIIFWDKYLVKISLLTDKLSMGKIGKSVILIWEKFV
jgi:2-polyprenyl-3-methyl-5-hydroxy-6-metoxy-1,4-benzoquinol methylase